MAVGRFNRIVVSHILKPFTGNPLSPSTNEEANLSEPLDPIFNRSSHLNNRVLEPESNMPPSDGFETEVSQGFDNVRFRQKSPDLSNDFPEDNIPRGLSPDGTPIHSHHAHREKGKEVVDDGLYAGSHSIESNEGHLLWIFTMLTKPRGNRDPLQEIPCAATYSLS